MIANWCILFPPVGGQTSRQRRERHNNIQINQHPAKQVPTGHIAGTSALSVRRHIKQDKNEHQEQIKDYIASQPGTKRSDIEALHQHILKAFPKCKLWFLDGKTKEFYQVVNSANTTGRSVYIMGIQDKKYLPETYGKTIGKASVAGYCIKFKTLEDINIDIPEAAIRDGVKQTS